MGLCLPIASSGGALGLGWVTVPRASAERAEQPRWRVPCRVSRLSPHQSPSDWGPRRCCSKVLLKVWLKRKRMFCDQTRRSVRGSLALQSKNRDSKASLTAVGGSGAPQ